MDDGDRCGRQGAIMPALVGPFRRRRRLPALQSHMRLWRRRWAVADRSGAAHIVCSLPMFGLIVMCYFQPLFVAQKRAQGQGYG